MGQDGGTKPRQTTRTLASLLKNGLERSSIVTFEKDMGGESSDKYDGWGVRVGELQCDFGRSRVYVVSWAGKSWGTRSRQIWAGLACSSNTPFRRAIKCSEGRIAPKYINEDNIEMVNGVALIKTKMPLPDVMEPVFEDFDGYCYLGLYGFDLNEAALAGTASDMIGDFIDATVTVSVLNEKNLSESVRKQLVLARRGQGDYRRRLKLVEGKCRLTGVSDDRLLTASHMKPWSRCRTNKERLDGHNGLLLTPTADRLFDRGLLTFDDNGTPKWSSRLDNDQRSLLKFDETSLIRKSFSKRHRQYLKYHRRYIFKP